MAMRRILRLSLFAVAMPVPATAQTTPIIVTGQGLPSSIGESAYDVKIIDRARLDTSASARLADILRDAAGFHQFRRSDSRSAHTTSQGAWNGRAHVGTPVTNAQLVCR